MHHGTEDFATEEILGEEEKLRGQKMSAGFIIFCICAALVIIGLGCVTINLI